MPVSSNMPIVDVCIFDGVPFGDLEDPAEEVLRDMERLAGSIVLPQNYGDTGAPAQMTMPAAASVAQTSDDELACAVMPFALPDSLRSSPPLPPPQMSPRPAVDAPQNSNDELADAALPPPSAQASL